MATHCIHRAPACAATPARRRAASPTRVRRFPQADARQARTARGSASCRAGPPRSASRPEAWRGACCRLSASTACAARRARSAAFASGKCTERAQARNANRYVTFPQIKKIDELRLNSAPPSIVAPRSLRSPSHAGHGHAWGRRTAAQRGGASIFSTNRPSRPADATARVHQGWVHSRPKWVLRSFLPPPIAPPPPPKHPSARKPGRLGNHLCEV